MSLMIDFVLAALTLCATDARRAPVEDAKEPTAPAEIRLAPARSPAGSGVLISSPWVAGETLELVTCEAVLDGDKDFGIFAVQPGSEGWQVEGGAWSYTWKLEPGLVLKFRARPERDEVALEYTLENRSERTLARAHLHPCLPTIGSPMFFPGTTDEGRAGVGGRAARVGRKDFSELYQRLHLWSEGKAFTFASSKAAPGEMHLAFLRAKEEPITWSWWKNAPETFDLPLVALASHDGKHALALGFERAAWASSNAGDPRACVHLFPLFGRIEKGETKTVRGRLYWIAGTPETARERFVEDFPEAGG